MRIEKCSGVRHGLFRWIAFTVLAALMVVEAGELSSDQVSCPPEYACITATAAGSNNRLQLTGNIRVPAAESGKAGNLYVVASLPAGGWYALTRRGWSPVGQGDIPAVASDVTLGDHAIPILEGLMDVSSLVGTAIYAGYGWSSVDLITNRKFAKIYEIAATGGSKPILRTTTSNLVIGGWDGQGWRAPSRTIKAWLDHATGTADWKIDNLPPWLSVSPAKGRLDAQGSELTFTVDPGILGFGMNETPVMLTANMGGEMVSSPIVVVTRVDKHLLLPSAWAIGLSSTPHFARLSQRLKVLDSFGVAASWQARSDAGWLRVTPSGSTGSGSELVVEANPDTLPSGQISYANVTILPDDARINPVQVKVALWKGGDAPETSRWMIPYSRIVADPLRPVVYVHNGGQAIDVYNAYTTHKVATIIEPGMIAGAMAVSPDGGTLYVYDGAASQVVTFDLQTQQKISSWPMRKLNDGPESLLVTRLNGVDLLLNSYGGVTRGEVFVGAPGLRGFVAASANGQRIFARRSSGEMVSVKLDYTHLFGGVLEVTGPPSEPFTAAAGSDIAVAADDSSIYTAGSGTGYCARLDPASLMPTDHFSVQQGVANNVEVTTDGRVVCGIRSIDLTADLWVHSATGAVIKHRRLAGAGTALRGRSLVLTPDGNVAVALTDDSAINFTGIGH